MKVFEDYQIDGEKVRALREELKLSQEKLAEVAGISRTQLQRIENRGVLNVKIGTMCKLEKALKVDRAALIMEVNYYE